MKQALFALSVVACGLAAAGTTAADPVPPPRAALDRDALFGKTRVLDLAIELDKTAAESLWKEPRKYVKGVLKEGDTAYANVGVHIKGSAGSLQGFDEKPGLTLNMDKFEDGQRFRGMDKFHLSNSVQDPTYLRELICGELYRAAGVPASRISHATLTLNGKTRLYYLKEGYDKQFLVTHFGSGNGNFYDGGFTRDIDQALELVSGKGDVADRGDLKALLSATRIADEKKRFAELEKLLDLDRFISCAAVAAITVDWDGYALRSNNYRVYHDPKTGKMTFLPSGMDQLYGDPKWPILPEWGGVVARELMSTKEGKRRYEARLREILDKVYKPDDLLKRLDELEAVVQPALAAVDAAARKDYTKQVSRLRDVITKRTKSIDEQLKKWPAEK